MLRYTIGSTVTSGDPFGIPSTSPWTGAAIIVKCSRLFVGGVKLPLALAELRLIDEYEFIVQLRLAGHGPTLFAGLSKRVDLTLVSRLEFSSGALALPYEPRR